jgi:hypothetical protein
MRLLIAWLTALWRALLTWIALDTFDQPLAA